MQDKTEQKGGPPSREPDAGARSGARVSYEELIRKGVFLFYREQERDAVEYLTSALTQNPDDQRARYLICLAAQLHSDEKLIEEMCAQARRIAPQNPYALACEGVRFMCYCNWARADEYFEQALFLVPNDVDLWFGRGMLYSGAGQYEKSVGAYLRVVTLDPGNVSGHVSLGDAYADIGEHEAAVTHYERAQALDPEAENPHQRLGRHFFYTGRPDEAARELQMAIEEQPDVPMSYFFLLAIHRQRGQTDAALDTYRAIRRRCGDQPDATGEMFEQIGAWEDALRDYRRSVEHDPEDTETRAGLVRCYRELGRWPELIDECREVLRRSPDNSSIRAELGSVLFRLGRYEEAIAECENVLAHDHLNSSACTTMADALTMLGRIEGASRAMAQLEQEQQKAGREYQRKFYGGTPNGSA